MSEKISVTVSHRFEASAERVYDAWLDPEKVRIWMPTAMRKMGLTGELGRIEVDARVGGRFLFSDIRDGVEAKHFGTYLELVRPSKIVFTWMMDDADESDPSKVTLTIQPEGSGCVATIVHEIDSEWADFTDQTKNGWHCMLQAIADNN